MDVQEAIDRYGTPEIFNTGQSSQLTSLTFTDLLKTHGIHISRMARVVGGTCLPRTRLWQTIKYEEVYLRAYESVSLAKASIGHY